MNMTEKNKHTHLEVPIEKYGRDTSGSHRGCVSELIQKRAYELFEQRGQLPGNDLDDWLHAEREVKHHLGL
jgi:hypothetical protein